MQTSLRLHELAAEAHERVARSWFASWRRRYQQQAHDYETAAVAAARVEGLKRAKDDAERARALPAEAQAVVA